MISETLLGFRHLPRRWAFRPQIQHGGLTVKGSEVILSGHSRSAEGTYFHLDPLDVQVDFGNSLGPARWNFLTHGHSDHTGGLLARLGDFPNSAVKPTVFMPQSLLPSMQRLVNSSLYKSRISVDLQGVFPGDRISLGPNYFCVPHHCDHSVETLGYTFVERVPLPKEGGEPEKTVNVPIISINGDTTEQVFYRNPRILKAPIVVTECTLFFDFDYGRAKKSKHTHYDDLVKVIVENPNTTFIITHFTLASSQADLHKLAKKLPPNAMMWGSDGTVKDRGVEDRELKRFPLTAQKQPNVWGAEDCTIKSRHWTAMRVGPPTKTE